MIWPFYKQGAKALEHEVTCPVMGREGGLELGVGPGGLTENPACWSPDMVPSVFHQPGPRGIDT